MVYESKIPAYTTLMNALDLLNNVEKMEILIGNITEEERNALYDHPLLNDENGKANDLMNELLP